MIKVNTKDSLTHSFDLTVEAEWAEWERKMADPEFIKNISGMAIYRDQVLHAMPLPRRFKSVKYEAGLVYGSKGSHRDKLIGESLSCHADGLLITLLVYHTNKAVRVDIMKLGKQRFAPTHTPTSKVGDAQGFQEAKEAVGP